MASWPSRRSWAVARPDMILARPAILSVPMGFKGSVAIIQAVVRRLVFVRCKGPFGEKVREDRPLPATRDLKSMCLDSFDHLRRVSKTTRDLVEGTPSAHHETFLQVCKELDLPLNEAKKLVGAIEGFFCKTES